MAEILYGKPVREKIKMELVERIKGLKKKPVLAVVQVGDREDSNVYIRQKKKFGEEIGVEVIVKKFEESIGEQNLIEEIKRLNEDERVNGIIIQLPLPESIDKENVIASIKKDKDADGLNAPHPSLRAALPLIKGRENRGETIPATARGVMAMLDFYNIEVKDKKVAVIGRSRLAGGPIAKILTEMGAEVTVCHRQTENMAEVCRAADILISAAGRPGLVTKEFVREGQVVVDVGINRTPSPALPRRGREFENPFLSERGRGEALKPKLVGDVAFEEVEPIVAAITPVPGGIGPLTVACLFWNLLDLTEK